MIKRNFKLNSPEVLVFLYKMYVRPHLEYCVQSWCPYLAKDIDILEKVQRRATKCLQGLTHLSYKNCLEKLHLYSLFCRCQRGGIIETYKILNSYYNTEPSKFFTLNSLITTRGHQYKLFKVRSSLRQNFFSNRVVNLWNSLPDSVVTTPTVASFKQQLDNYWIQSGYGHFQRPAA